jgi:hypothetical protein
LNVFRCATDFEWAKWLAMWERARAPKRPTDDPVGSFCVDCTPEFHAEMVALELCIVQHETPGTYAVMSIPSADQAA